MGSRGAGGRASGVSVRGTGMDVGAWLRGLGLGQYEQAFRDNAVDAEVLRELTGDDLKDLGVSLVGHRRRLLAALAALREGVASPSASSSRPELVPPAAPGPVARSPEAERRQLTVMFVDLVGSTALSSRPRPRGDARRAAGLPERGSGRGRRASRATSPSSWATVFWPTSAGRGRTRTRPSGPCVLASRSWPRWRS